ncbi:MAG: LiaI-LiaF-like domain-containing protein [Candidatus Aminicenantes bacterium]
MEEKVIVKKPPKSAALAGILSFFFPGIGALYNRQFLKGAVIIIVFAGLVTMQTTGEGQPFLGIILGAFYIYQIIDAVQTSKIINRRVLEGKEEEMEEVEELPGVVKTGSIFWGAALIVLGGLLLLANFEVIPYDTLFDFWPLVVIVIGVKLVADYASKRS